MEWNIDYLEEQGVVLITTSGPMNWADHKKMCEEAFQFGQSRNAHRYLADHRNVEPGLNILEIDDLPKMFRDIGVGAEQRVAVLYNPDEKDKYKFFQSVSNIALLSFRLFDDKEKAMDWLKHGE